MRDQSSSKNWTWGNINHRLSDSESKFISYTKYTHTHTDRQTHQVKELNCPIKCQVHYFTVGFWFWLNQRPKWVNDQENGGHDFDHHHCWRLVGALSNLWRHQAHASQSEGYQSIFIVHATEICIQLIQWLQICKWRQTGWFRVATVDVEEVSTPLHSTLHLSHHYRRFIIDRHLLYLFTRPQRQLPRNYSASDQSFGQVIS